MAFVHTLLWLAGAAVIGVAVVRIVNQRSAGR